MFEAWSEAKYRNKTTKQDDLINSINENLSKIVNENQKYFEIDSIYHNLSIPSTHLESSNLWFLKVTKLNRGRGIYVFNSVDQLISLINDWTECIEGSTIIRDTEENKNYLVKNKQKHEFVKIPTLSWNRNSLNANDSDSNWGAK